MAGDATGAQWMPVPCSAEGVIADFYSDMKSKPTRAMLQSMLSKAREHYVPSYFIALVQEALGQREDALESLERAWEERDSWLSFAAVTPVLDDLRAEPRLRELLRQMGLPEGPELGSV